MAKAFLYGVNKKCQESDLSDADAVVADVLADKTFYAGDLTKKTGTMVNRGAVSTDITTKNQEVTIAQGYHNGSGKIGISATEKAKIIPENIAEGITVLGQLGTHAGGVVFPSEEFIEFGTDVNGSSSPSQCRFLTFLSGNPCRWDTPVVVNIYHKIDGIDTLIVTKTMDFDGFYIIRIPRSSGLLKITMSLVPADDCYEWAKFSGFYAKIKCPGYQTIVQLPALDGQEDFVLSYVDFDVFHVTFTSLGD